MADGKITYRDKSDGTLKSVDWDATLERHQIIRCREEPCVIGEADDAFIACCLPGLLDDVAQANPIRGRNRQPLGRLTAIKSAPSTSVTVQTEPDVIFDDDAPFIIADNLDVLDSGDLTQGNVAWGWCTSATIVSTTPTVRTHTITLSPSIGGIFGDTYYIGAVVFQPQAGKFKVAALGNGIGKYERQGLRHQLERPDPPSIAVASVSGVSVTFTVTIGADNNYHASYIDVFVYDSLEDALNGIEMWMVEPDAPDVATLLDNTERSAGKSVSVSGVTTYRGGTGCKNGGNLATGTYWAVAILKENSGCFACVKSLPSVPVEVTIP